MRFTRFSPSRASERYRSFSRTIIAHAKSAFRGAHCRGGRTRTPGATGRANLQNAAHCLRSFRMPAMAAAKKVICPASEQVQNCGLRRPEGPSEASLSGLGFASPSSRCALRHGSLWRHRAGVFRPSPRSCCARTRPRCRFRELPGSWAVEPGCTRLRHFGRCGVEVFQGMPAFVGNRAGGRLYFRPGKVP